MVISNSDIILVVNALVYFISFMFFQKKMKYFGGISVVPLIYAVSATASIYLYNHKYSFSQFSEITILPFVYLFVAFFIAFLPLLFVHEEKIIAIIPPRKEALNIYIIFTIIVVLIKLPGIILNLANGLKELTNNFTYFADLYQDRSETLYGGQQGANSISIINVLFGLVSEISIFFFLYYLSLRNKNKLLVWGLLISVIAAPLSSIASAQRGSLSKSILLIVCLFLFFKKHYPKRIQKVYKIIILSTTMMLGLGLIVISISRFSQSYMDEEYAGYMAANYIGQPFLNFNNHGFDTNGIRNGDRTTALFKSIIEPDGGAYDYSQRMLKYANLKMDESVFSTFVGDLVLDYGTILTLLLLAIFSFLLIDRRKIKEVIPFYKLIPVFSILYLFIGGWTLFPFADVGGNLKIIFLIFLYLYFKVDYQIKMKQL